MFVGKFIFLFTTRSSSASFPGGRARPRHARPGVRCRPQQVPPLGYTVTYAVGNTLYDWGMVVIMLLS